MLLPDFFLWFLGAGMGWAIVSWVMFRRNVRREYQQAIRHLRRSEYDEAIQIMNDLIRAEPVQSAHHRFRADLYRLKGDSKRALKDYRRIVELEPDSGVGYNGLAEVYLQQGDYDQALEYAKQAYAVEPGQWVMPYNLGMIEDRLGLAAEAAAHLEEALDATRPDARHQVLIHLWLARAYMRLGQPSRAEVECAELRHLKGGLREWETIFASEQSTALREVLEEDLTLARRIADGAGPDVFVESTVPSEAKS
jgi:predicted Zn-dependent protease